MASLLAAPAHALHQNAALVGAVNLVKLVNLVNLVGAVNLHSYGRAQATVYL